MEGGGVQATAVEPIIIGETTTAPKTGTRGSLSEASEPLMPKGVRRIDR